MSTNSKVFSRLRTTIETAFYGNNVETVRKTKRAYEMAKNSPGTIVTDMEVFKPEQFGLKKHSKVLLFNDGEVTGRCAKARKVIGEEGVCKEKYSALVREATYQSRYKKMYHLTTYVGLDEEFMVKAHLLIPEKHENIMYNWLMNFQAINDEYKKMYEKSRDIGEEGDIYIFSDPDWKDESHPYGLTLFDPENNCAAILGMRYFGEHKKGTLTMAWNIANRNGYIPCHGGQKRYTLSNGSDYVLGVFGLSGSGKSTLTHYKHDEKFDIEILHDDAFIIAEEDGSSIALEPSYFDKTQDYPMDSEENKYLISAQNCGATKINGKCMLVTEDIRNGNGRAIKSRLWSPNRVDRFKSPVDSIIWLMKDESLPPILKINNSDLAATMGATLATKRTSAERIIGKSLNELVIEPYANPFRIYPLKNDYNKFKNLFESKNISCYILNTGHFMDKKVPKEVTLNILEQIVKREAKFCKWSNLEDIEILKIEGFEPNMEDENYIDKLKAGFERRKEFIESKKIERAGFDELPKESVIAIEKVINNLTIKNRSNVVAD